MKDSCRGKPSIERTTSEESSGDDNATELEQRKPNPDTKSGGTIKAGQDLALPEDNVPVTDEWVGITVYLPESLRDELDLVYRKHNVNRKCSADPELKKLRHYYPLIVALGLERVKDMKGEDIAPMLAQISSRYE